MSFVSNQVSLLEIAAGFQVLLECLHQDILHTIQRFVEQFFRVPRIRADLRAAKDNVELTFRLIVRRSMSLMLQNAYNA